jgi:hypothetical protein
MDCKFCNKRFSSIYTLKYHQENTRYCLIKQGKKKYICNYCNTELKNNKKYIEHLNNCLINYEEKNEIKNEIKIKNYFSTLFYKLLIKLGNLTYYKKQHIFIKDNYSTRGEELDVSLDDIV